MIRGVASGLKGLANAVKNGIVAGFKAGINEAGKILDKINPLSSITGNIVKDSGDAGKGIGGSIPGGAFLGAGGGGDTGGLQIEARTGLGMLRRQFGGLTLSSGFRSPAENARVGGAPNSDHLTGLGTDLVPTEGWTFSGINKLDRIAAWARKSPLIRWIGWRGVKGHGPGNHLHLSWVDRMKGDVRAAAGLFGRHPKERVIGLGGGAAGDTVPQIRNLWTRAGGSAARANMAAAIAMAESAGNPGAKNVNTDGSIDRGLWQINSVHGALSTFGRLANARAAVRISGNGRNWNPWVTFKSGAYRRFLRSGGGGGGGPTLAGGHPQATTTPQPTSYTPQGPSSSFGFGAFTPTGPQSSFGFGGGGGWSPTEPVPWWEREVPESPEPDTSAEDARTAAIEANTRATEEHTAALTEVGVQMKRQTDFATSTVVTDKFQALKFATDLISGQFGRGIVGRGMTPGTGVEVAF